MFLNMLRSQFMEHIDLRKFLPGFVMSYQMPYFQASGV